MDKMAKKLNTILQNMNIRSNAIAKGSKLAIDESSNPNKPNSEIEGTTELTALKDEYLQQNCADYGKHIQYLKNHNKEAQQWLNDIKKEKQSQKGRNEEDELRRKYQSMKDSLGLSKHIPSEIIL
jgi:hypothetical protein